MSEITFLHTRVFSGLGETEKSRRLVLYHGKFNCSCGPGDKVTDTGNESTLNYLSGLV